MESLLQAQWCPGLVALRYVGSWGVPGGARSKGDIGDRDSFPGSGRSPGGGHSNHCSILAWKILQTEDPGGLWSTGSQRVRHNWNNLTHTHTHTRGILGPQPGMEPTSPALEGRFQNTGLPGKSLMKVLKSIFPKFLCLSFTLRKTKQVVWGFLWDGWLLLQVIESGPLESLCW